MNLELINGHAYICILHSSSKLFSLYIFYSVWQNFLGIFLNFLIDGEMSLQLLFAKYVYVFHSVLAFPANKAPNKTVFRCLTWTFGYKPRRNGYQCKSLENFAISPKATRQGYSIFLYSNL